MITTLASVFQDCWKSLRRRIWNPKMFENCSFDYSNTLGWLCYYYTCSPWFVGSIQYSYSMNVQDPLFSIFNPQITHPGQQSWWRPVLTPSFLPILALVCALFLWLFQLVMQSTHLVWWPRQPRYAERLQVDALGLWRGGNGEFVWRHRGYPKWKSRGGQGVFYCVDTYKIGWRDLLSWRLKTLKVPPHSWPCEASHVCSWQG